MTTADSLLLSSGAGASLLALAGMALWRLGIEFERTWLEALAAPPTPWEQDLFDRHRSELRVLEASAEPIAAKAMREAVLV